LLAGIYNQGANGVPELTIDPARGTTSAPASAATFARLRPVLVPVVLGGSIVLASAVYSLVLEPPSGSALAGLVALFAAALMAESFPIPIESLPAGHSSLATVFFAGAAVLFGWAEATVLAVVARITIELVQRRPRVRSAHNIGSYALAASAAGATAGAFDRNSTAGLVLAVLGASVAYYGVNVMLLAGVVARWSAEPYVRIAANAIRWAALPLALTASGTLMLVVLWERAPLLSFALVGPVLAIALYQRSMHNALVATRLALTDPLTGLGNQRHFRERLQQELDSAAAEGRPLALCLLDVDRLKRVNDSFGHPAGDRLLELVGGCLRHGGEAYRVGGDEFALLLPGRDVDEAVEAAEAILIRTGALDPPEGAVSISGGLAVYPTHVVDRSELYRAADQALYRSKREGGRRVHVYQPEDPRPLGAAAFG
jgi:diguanylate cyclase (GGDEF)-like protein